MLHCQRKKISPGTSLKQLYVNGNYYYYKFISALIYLVLVGILNKVLAWCVRCPVFNLIRGSTSVDPASG